MPAIARWSRSSACSRRDSRRRISPSRSASEPERLRAEVRELRGRGLGREQPDAGALLLRASVSTSFEPPANSSANAGVFGPFSPAWRNLAVRPSSGARAGRARRRRSERGAASRGALRRGAASFERRERRVECLQRRDVRRTGLRDRERRDRVDSWRRHASISGNSGIGCHGSDAGVPRGSRGEARRTPHEVAVADEARHAGLGRSGSTESAGSGSASGSTRSLRIGERAIGMQARRRRCRRRRASCEDRAGRRARRRSRIRPGSSPST